ncbi:MAG TPA: class I SAM-dependent methyltransferase [Vicinamibacteria bacterium]|nr:class I SAM-dependent methyltransferase [Vicinamibacteria bacterium]
MTARYLEPYVEARRRKARGVDALLWEDRRSQRIRFEAIARLCPLAGQRVLDVGCGQADLLGFLQARGTVPAHYTGLEAQPWLARAARRKRYLNCSIVEGDFVAHPARLEVGADVLVFSGSLNFLSSRLFYRSLDAAWAASRQSLVFNFLCSPDLAGAKGLRWHRRDTVLAFARGLTSSVRMDDAYEDGDCTVVMRQRTRRAR